MRSDTSKHQPADDIKILLECGPVVRGITLAKLMIEIFE